MVTHIGVGLIHPTDKLITQLRYNIELGLVETHNFYLVYVHVCNSPKKRGKTIAVNSLSGQYVCFTVLPTLSKV